MKQFVVATLGFAAALLTLPTAGLAADQCPTELTQAKAALKSAQASLKKNPQVAKGQDIQAPRSQAGARSQDIQAPRGQQDIQAPRGQQEIPVPRGQDIQAPRVNQAATLVQEADAACKKGDTALSTRKAKEALGLLKK
jgi:hypothetical protein